MAEDLTEYTMDPSSLYLHTISIIRQILEYDDTSGAVVHTVFNEGLYPTSLPLK